MARTLCTGPFNAKWETAICAAAYLFAALNSGGLCIVIGRLTVRPGAQATLANGFGVARLTASKGSIVYGDSQASTASDLPENHRPSM